MGVTDLAERLDIGKSNVHRVLQSLVEQGYVLKDEASGTYRASLKIWEVGQGVLTGLSVRNVAAPELNALMTITRETTVLSVLDGVDVIYIDKVDSSEPVHIYTSIGRRVPAYCAATGKAMLGFLERAVVERVFARVEPHTGNTITQPDVFDAEIALVRKQHVAINRGEWRDSVWGVAAPIFDGSGAVVAGVGISGPENRVRASLKTTIIPAVKESAMRITAALSRR